MVTVTGLPVRNMIPVSVRTINGQKIYSLDGLLYTQDEFIDEIAYRGILDLFRMEADKENQ